MRRRQILLWDGSKSNTSRASLGSEIRLSKSRGAQTIGSVNLDGAETL